MFIFNVVLVWSCLIAEKGLLQAGKKAGKKPYQWIGNGDNNVDVTAEYPFLVGLVSNGFVDGNVVCTGTLISQVFVMSTAHCPSRLQGGKIKVSMWDGKQ